MRIDAHHHFWRYSRSEYEWLSDDMQILQRDYLPKQFEPLLRGLTFDGSVVVQARHKLVESRWLLELADRHDFIKGVVGWVDLRSPRLDRQLHEFARHPKFKGVRHMVHDEPDDEFLLRPNFQQGISRLGQFSLTYDLLLFTVHLPAAVQLVDNYPEQSFVLDHISKPLIHTGRLSPWKERLGELARRENVACKLSGLVTETTWRQWSNKDFWPYLDVALEAFGPRRLMIGSDWPVCLVSGSYESVMGVVLDYIGRLSDDEQAEILGRTAARVYNLELGTN